MGWEPKKRRERFFPPEDDRSLFDSFLCVFWFDETGSCWDQSAGMDKALPPARSAICSARKTLNEHCEVAS